MRATFAATIGLDTFRVGVVRSMTCAKPGRRTALIRYRRDIDGLRGIAILLVLGFHAAPQYFKAGFTGVDIFFVISGYLISRIIYDGIASGTFSFRQFYIRRVRRIFPALSIVLFASFGLGWFLLVPADFALLGKHIVATAAFCLNIVLWQEAGYFDVSSLNKLLLHLWSLGVEEQFYLVRPPLLVLMLKAKRLVVPLLALILGASFLWSAFTTPIWPVAAFYLPFARLWELVAGGALAWIERDPAREGGVRSRLLNELFSTFGVALLAASMFLISAASAFPGYLAALPVAGAVLLLAGRTGWANRYVLSNGVLVFLGLISYPLYLWHWVLLTFATMDRETPASWQVLCLVVAASIAAAWLTYRLVEVPLRFGALKPFSTRILVPVMAAAALLGVAADTTSGFLVRLPKYARELALNDKKGDITGLCYLNPVQDTSYLKPSCLDPGDVSRGPLTMVWGDSHAGSLYPGIRAYLARPGAPFRMAGFSTSACPPLVGYVNPGRRYCKSVNDLIFGEVKRLRPARLVLSADWASWSWLPGLDKMLEDEIAAFQAAGVKQVVFVGPFPRWTIFQSKVALKLLAADPKLRRTLRFSDPKPFETDKQLRGIVARTAAIYASPVDLLCNKEGCRLFPGKDRSATIAFDAAHLTPPGATYLAARIFKAMPATEPPGGGAPR
jgi:peptidoglycan/LPS O-acetylase OafA/YrhL